MVLAGSVLGLGALTMASAADQKPEDVVKYRQSVYTIIGWNFPKSHSLIKIIRTFNYKLSRKKKSHCNSTSIKLKSKP